MSRSPIVPLEKSLTLRSPAALVGAGIAPLSALEGLDRVAERYAVAVTPAMAKLIDPSDPLDPISAQFVPSTAELTTLPEERADPIGDDAHSPVPGLVHRYRDRVLLKLVHVCAVYCRFCFRRETVGPGGPTMLGEEEIGRALAYIRERPEIWEVVFTGGDPLVIAPRRLAELLETAPGVYVETGTLVAAGAVEWLAGRFGAHRLVFGTGAPRWDDAGARFLLDHLDLPADDVAMIAAGSAAALLGERWPW